MKQLLLAVLASMTYSISAAQTPEQFSKNAELFAAKASDSITIVQEAKNEDGWIKIYARGFDAAWDVKKTDSMLAPVIGFVTLELAYSSSSIYSTKAEAEASTEKKGDFVDKVELQYIPTKTGWELKSGRKFFRAVKTWMPVSQKFAPDEWVISGFSVKK